MKNLEELMTQGRIRRESRRDEFVRKSLLSDEFLDLIQKFLAISGFLMPTADIFPLEQLIFVQTELEIMCTCQKFLTA